MNFKVIITLILLSGCPTWVFANLVNFPKDTSQINIGAVTSVSGKEYRIDIYRWDKNIKIVYYLLDSVKWKSLKKDETYNRLTSILMKGIPANANKDTLTKQFNRLENIRQQYCVYSRDSVLLNTQTDTAYNNLLTRIFKASNQTLENTEVSKNYIVIDGTSFNFKITAENLSRTVYAHSPSPDSHPLLYALINESMAIYRNRKNDTFLTKRRTSGY